MKKAINLALVSGFTLLASCVGPRHGERDGADLPGNYEVTSFKDWNSWPEGTYKIADVKNPLSILVPFTDSMSERRAVRVGDLNYGPVTITNEIHYHHNVYLFERAPESENTLKITDRPLAVPAD